MTVTLGLISDTHMPQRWRQLPENLPEIFADVDLILHSGDVGQLWVLDQLSQIAPIVAVHGNDETDEATQALPFLQTLVIAGQRIVMTHGHYPDRAQEMAMRKFDSWTPKMDRLANFAHAHGAKILISGHTHIPMAHHHNGVLLINPGAFACGSCHTRQAIQTVARLTISDDAPPQVTHIDVNHNAVHIPQVAADWAKGFNHTMQRYTDIIVSDELLGLMPWVRTTLLSIAGLHHLEVCLFPLLYECWECRKEKATLAEVVEAITTHPETSDEVLEAMRQVEALRAYM